MFIPDFEIERLCSEKNLVSPYNAKRVQPASYDVRLMGEVLRHNGSTRRPLDLRYDDPAEYLVRSKVGDYYVIDPGEFVLGSTVEIIKVPNNITTRFEGKSTLGRIGLMTHVTAGFVDSGFEGRITLEIKNIAPWPIVLYTNMEIGQVSFSYNGIIDKDGYPKVVDAARPYGSAGTNHYTVQNGPVAAVGKRGKPSED